MLKYSYILCERGIFMQLPNIWGQGALFAYSGLEGECTLKNSFTCTLLGDNLGLRLHTDKACDLYVTTEEVCDIRYQIVASDIISAEIETRGGAVYETLFLFYNQNTIIGKCRKGSVQLRMVNNADRPPYFYETSTETETCFSVSTQQETAVTPEMVAQTAAKKLAFYEALPDVGLKDKAIEKAFYKAVSVMKSQVYSKEGQFKRNWTTPDRLPHKALWLWDSVFHSFGNRFISEALAKDSILAVLDAQRQDGFIAHMATPDSISDVTQPPVLAWGIMRLFNRTKDIALLEETYPKLRGYLTWNMENRTDKHGLYVWHVDTTSVDCRCDESGMDNCSRFDGVKDMECIDFSCFMVMEAEAMASMCEILQNGEGPFWKAFAEELKEKINTRLWDEADGFYYDRIVANDSFHKVKSNASFLPMLAGVCSTDQAAKLVAHLDNPDTFKEAVGVPGIAKEDPTYGTDMWRGPVWLNYNYLVLEGLKKYGYIERYETFVKGIVEEVTKWYLSDGVLYEFYDPSGATPPSRLMRKGPVIEPYNFNIRYQAIRDYGWTCSMFACIILENKHLFEST